MIAAPETRPAPAPSPAVLSDQEAAERAVEPGGRKRRPALLQWLGRRQRRPYVWATPLEQGRAVRSELPPRPPLAAALAYRPSLRPEPRRRLEWTGLEPEPGSWVRVRAARAGQRDVSVRKWAPSAPCYLPPPTCAPRKMPSLAEIATSHLLRAHLGRCLHSPRSLPPTSYLRTSEDAFTRRDHEGARKGDGTPPHIGEGVGVQWRARRCPHQAARPRRGWPPEEQTEEHAEKHCELQGPQRKRSGVLLAPTGIETCERGGCGLA